MASRSRSTAPVPKSSSQRPLALPTTSASRVVSSSSQVSTAPRTVTSTSSPSSTSASTTSSTLSISSTPPSPSPAVKHTTHRSSYSSSPPPSPTVPINSNNSHQRFPMGVIIALSAIGAFVVLGAILWHLYPRCSYRSRGSRGNDSPLPIPRMSGTFGGGGHGGRHSMYVEERHYLAAPALPRHSHTRSAVYGNPFETALEKSDSGSSGNNYPTVPSAPFRLGDAGGDPPSFNHPPSSSPNSLSDEKTDVAGVGGPSTGPDVVALSPESLPSNSSSNASSLSIIGARSSPSSNAPPNNDVNNSSDEAAPQTVLTRQTSQASSLSSHASASATVPRPAHPPALVPGFTPISIPAPNNNPINSNPNPTPTSRRVSRDNSTSRYSTYSAHSGHGSYGYGSSSPSLRGSASIRGAPHLPHIRPQVEIVLPRPLAAAMMTSPLDREMTGGLGRNSYSSSNDVQSSYHRKSSSSSSGGGGGFPTPRTRTRSQPRSPLYEEYEPSSIQSSSSTNGNGWTNPPAAQRKHPHYSQQQQYQHVPRINPTSGRRRSTTVEGERQKEVMGDQWKGSRRGYSLDEADGGAKMRDSLGLTDELGSLRNSAAPSAWRGSAASGNVLSQPQPPSHPDSLSSPLPPAVPAKDDSDLLPGSFIQPASGLDYRR